MSMGTLSPVLNVLSSLWNSAPELPRSIKLERRLILGRWVGIAVFAIGLAFNPHPTAQTLAAYVILGLAFVYNVVLSRLFRQALPRLVLALPTLVDGLL